MSLFKICKIRRRGNYWLLSYAGMNKNFFSITVWQKLYTHSNTKYTHQIQQIQIPCKPQTYLHVTLQILCTNSAHAMPFSHPISKDDSHPAHPNTHSSVSAEAETPPADPADPAPPHGVWANADNWDTAVETTNAIPNYSGVRSGTEYGLYKSPPVGGWYAWLIRCY